MDSPGCALQEVRGRQKTEVQAEDNWKSNGFRIYVILVQLYHVSVRRGINMEGL